MLDSIYHMKLRVLNKSHFWLEKSTLIYNLRHYVNLQNL